jgi:hypothetical protein
MADDYPAWNVTLPCGCRRGFVLCAEAQRLWRRVADAHHAVVTQAAPRDEWEAARRKYDAHFEGHDAANLR